jgi:predicted phosphodiesterase
MQTSNQKFLPKKQCSKCHVKKAANLDNFGPDARGLYKLRGDCRDCRRKSDLANKHRRQGGQKLYGSAAEMLVGGMLVASLKDKKVVTPEDVTQTLDNLLSDLDKAYDKDAKSSLPPLKVRSALALDYDLHLAPGTTTERVLIIPDCHHPYHDKKAWALLLKAARVFKPDIIIILGDFADFYAVSSHSKNPNRVRNLEAEVAAVNDALDELDTIGAARKVFVSGNHCDRLERYLMDRAPELFNMVSVRDLFELPKRGWSFVPYKRHAKIGHLYVTHDTNRAGRYAHYQSQADFGGANVVIGHTHRLGYMVEGSAQGQPHVSAMFGWLGDFDQVDYMHQVRARRDWSHGFGLGYLQPDGCVHLTPVPIINGKVVIEGETVSV